jgi:hypothetical protein
MILHLLSMHKKAGHLNLSLKHRSEDSRFGSWPTTQAWTNNLKDHRTKDKNTNLHPDLLHGEENNEIKAQSRNKENAGKVLSPGAHFGHTQIDSNSEIKDIV